MKTLTEKMAAVVEGKKQSIRTATVVLDRNGMLDGRRGLELNQKYRRLTKLEQYLEERAWR